MNDKRLLFAKFQDEEIFYDLGRILFSLLKVFASGGYQIKLCDNLQSKDLGKYGRLIYSFESLSLTEMPPSDTERWIYLFDREDKVIGNRPWNRKIGVRFDVFSTYRFKNPIIMPFPVHPALNTPDLEGRLKKLRSTTRNVSIFFSGDTKGYKKLRVRYPKPKMSRLDIVNTIRDEMSEDLLLVQEQSTLDSLSAAQYINKCVIVDTHEIWVDDRDWLSHLARADFFLSPPGALMPMCHNATEAMAVGAIPITNYPEWFDPKLIHMENCIVFGDRADLIEKINNALNMDKNLLVRIRENAVNYYETHLKSEAALRRIESHKDSEIMLLIRTGHNVRLNASKLKKNSILMRGTSTPKKKWSSRLLGL